MYVCLNFIFVTCQFMWCVEVFLSSRPFQNVHKISKRVPLKTVFFLMQGFLSQNSMTKGKKGDLPGGCEDVEFS